MDIQRDEPLTPSGRIFLRPDMNLIITCAIGNKNALDIDAIRSQLCSSMLLQHPRFCSLLVMDRKGREYWRKTQLNIDQHFIIIHESISDTNDEEAVNEYLADLAVSSPLSTDKPLWEIHFLMVHKCAVFRAHHALGDGISMMAMLLSCFRRADDPSQPPLINSVTSSSSSNGRRNESEWKVWKVAKVVWYTLIFMFAFVLRSLWVKDKKTVVSGGAGVELWPRKLATAKFQLDDLKVVKKAIADATINDVLFGVISSGLSRYLDTTTKTVQRDGLQMTGLSMVNLRPQPGLQDLSMLMRSKSGTRWGNKFGMVLLPVCYQRGGTDPLQFVNKAKKMIDKKKLSLEALLSYKLGKLVVSCFGPKIASSINYKIICNTTFSFSNLVGPQEDITFVGNPITYLRVNSSSVPHAITMHMVSYAGRAEMQILVAKDIIPNPQVLAKCFEDALLEMKEVAVQRLPQKLEELNV